MNMMLDSFKQVIKDRCGLMFEGISQDNLQKALQQRMRVLTLQADSYLRRIAADQQEFDELICLLTINETYFFREHQQLEMLCDYLLPTLLAHKPEDQPVTILSAGCSTGEEPYSIAMALLERFGRRITERVEIRAGDIDQQALAKAKLGSYSAFSFRGVDEPIRQKYFIQEQGRFRIKPDVQQWVKFQSLNLLSQHVAADLEGTDIIFFRNVSIYFDTATRHAILSNFYRMLQPEGILLVGVAETLANDLGVFQLQEHGGLFYFTKQLVPHKEPIKPVELAPPVPSDSGRVNKKPLQPLARKPLEPETVLQDVHELLHKKRYDEAAALLRGLLAEQANQQATILLAWVQLQRRDFASARELANEVLVRDEWSVEAMMILAFAARWQGDLDEALRCFRQAAFLRNDNWAVQYYLADTHRAMGNREPARRGYRTCLRLMGDSPVAQGGLQLPWQLPVAEMRFLCEKHGMSGANTGAAD